MYNRHWFIATLLFLACFSLSLYKEFNLQSDLIANLITFLYSYCIVINGLMYNGVFHSF